MLEANWVTSEAEVVMFSYTDWKHFTLSQVACVVCRCDLIYHPLTFAGHFTEPQRKLYNATLRVQEACIRMCTTEFSLDDIYNHMLVLLGAELTQLGIISPDCSIEQRLHVSGPFKI